MEEKIVHCSDCKHASLIYDKNDILVEGMLDCSGPLTSDWGQHHDRMFHPVEPHGFCFWGEKGKHRRLVWKEPKGYILVSETSERKENE